MPYPAPSAVLELLKPITWFPPMWAYGCGVVSAGVPVSGNWPLVLAGVALAGPMVCGTSQAVNDWYDREVDAINEPARPIPSGRVPGSWGLRIALVWTALSLLLAIALGPWGLGAAVVGLALAWAYSAPPVRLKRNGWWGNTACAVCYEGLPWFTAAAVMSGARPEWTVLILAGLYSIGGHGIMTLNDFKSVEGDRRMGIGSLPVRLGVDRAALVACLFMALPQIGVVALLASLGRTVESISVLVLVLAQTTLMRRLLRSPAKLAPWYNATGTSLFVIGMVIAAFAIRPGGMSLP